VTKYIYIYISAYILTVAVAHSCCLPSRCQSSIIHDARLLCAFLSLAGSTSLAPSSSRPPTGGATEQPLSRRASLGALWTVAGSGGLWLAAPAADAAQDTAIADAKQFVKTSYPDFTKTYAGWSYREVTAGKTGSTRAATGDRVIFALHNWTLGGPVRYLFHHPSSQHHPRIILIILALSFPNPLCSSSKRRAPGRCF
jgi:hypothetical protein